MNNKDLKTILSALHSFVLGSRPAYKDYLGEETIEIPGVVVCECELPNGEGYLNAVNPCKFAEGETYLVTVGDETAEYKTQLRYGKCWLCNVAVETADETEDFWAVNCDGTLGISKAVGSYVGQTITVSTLPTSETHKRYDVRKLPEDCVPESVTSGIESAKKAASKATINAQSARNLADSAYGWAEYLDGRVNTLNRLININSQNGVELSPGWMSFPFDRIGEYPALYLDENYGGLVFKGGSNSRYAAIYAGQGAQTPSRILIQYGENAKRGNLYLCDDFLIAGTARANGNSAGSLQYTPMFEHYRTLDGKRASPNTAWDSAVIEIDDGGAKFETSRDGNTRLTLSEITLTNKKVAVALSTDASGKLLINNKQLTAEDVGATAAALTSPNGTKYTIAVDDEGVLHATKVEEAAE